MTMKRRAKFTLCLAGLLLLPSVALSNDFPTRGRVEYVLDCMRKYPQRAEFEMLAKCSCAVDKFAEELSYDEFVELLTATLAVTIGGERGATVRDAADTRTMIKRFHAIEGKANEACFIQ